MMYVDGIPFLLSVLTRKHSFGPVYFLDIKCNYLSRILKKTTLSLGFPISPRQTELYNHR